MKVINKDTALAALKHSLREAQLKGDHQRAAFANGLLIMMRELPEIDVTDGIECGSCFFYNREAKRCTHPKGLNGKVRSKMYCSYGSYHRDTVDDEEDEDDFNEFEEEPHE